MQSKTKTIIISVIAIAAILILGISALIFNGKAGKAATGAAEAEKAAAAYAVALAESTAKVNETSAEIQDLEQRAAAAEDAPLPDFSGEAGIYSDFISGDSEIRNALSALAQDDPDLVKNYRIKVDLRNMEKVKLPEGDGRRVRFEGRFVDPSARKNAVIRISGTEGSYSGRIYISDLRYDGDKSLNMSALSDEDVASSHGAGLKSAGVTELKGQKCVFCEVEFTGDPDKDKAAVQIPLGDLDSSGFSTVNYDLYFEGENPDLRFTTGCDFAGKEEISSDLDAINEAFAIYRGKAAAGQEDGSAKEAVISAIDRMKSDLNIYPGSDPLVIGINEALDRKAALINGESTAEIAEVGEAGEDKEKESASPAEKKSNAWDAGNMPVVSSQSGDAENGGGVIGSVITVLIMLLGIFMVIFLGVMLNREGGSVRTSLEKAEKEKEKADAESDELRRETEALRGNMESAREKIDRALYDHATLAGCDISSAKAAAEEIRGRVDAFAANIKRFERDNRQTAANSSTGKDIEKILGGLMDANAAFKEHLQGIISQLDETSGSVKNINKAATIISDIAGETNLLALNASIEAARAGETGRGFAVVAGEISKLAEQTEKSVSEITDTVERLNSDFEKTGRFMQELQESAAGQDESVSDVKDRIDAAIMEMDSNDEAEIRFKELSEEYNDLSEELSALTGQLLSELSQIEAGAKASSETEKLLNDIRSGL